MPVLSVLEYLQKQIAGELQEGDIWKIFQI